MCVHFIRVAVSMSRSNSRGHAQSTYSSVQSLLGNRLERGLDLIPFSLLEERLLQTFWNTRIHAGGNQRALLGDVEVLSNLS